MLELLGALNHDVFGLLDAEGRLRPRALVRAFAILGVLLGIGLLLLGAAMRVQASPMDTVLLAALILVGLVFSAGTVILVVQLLFLGLVKVAAWISTRHRNRRLP